MDILIVIMIIAYTLYVAYCVRSINESRKNLELEYIEKLFEAYNIYISYYGKDDTSRKMEDELKKCLKRLKYEQK